MFPVRCYTCNALLAHIHRIYERDVHAGMSEADALATHKVERMCCRRMFLGYVDITREIIEFPNVDMVLDESGTVLKREVRFERTVSCD